MVKIPTNAWDTSSQSIIANDDLELLQAEEELDNAVHALKKCYRNIQLDSDTELTVDSMRLAAERWKEGLRITSILNTQTSCGVHQQVGRVHR
jgi:hypothetical protein